jgi:NADPH:quinone reductase-like Zn-dependent oxidoreductase
MRAVVVREHGGVEALRLEDVETPEPGPGQVRVRVAAVGINHLDVWVRRGVPGHHFPLPLTPGSDVSGTVEALGVGVTGLAPGDRVVLHPVVSCGLCRECRSGNESVCRDLGILGETRDGGCAEQIVVPRANVLPVPEGLDFEAAAAIPLVFLTAWHMLVARARIRPGHRVLVHAAGSGVSSAAIQIARLHGASVLATAGSREKCDRALELGAERSVNYREDDFVKAVRDWTGKRGVDVPGGVATSPAVRRPDTS